MAQIVVRNLDEEVKRRLQRRAERHGRSMEAEARAILTYATAEENAPGRRLGSRIAARFAGLGMDFNVRELRGNPARPAEFDE